MVGDLNKYKDRKKRERPVSAIGFCQNLDERKREKGR